MAGKLKVYEYSNCSTCKKALKFLDARQISYERIAIVEHPPSVMELKAVLRNVGGDLRKLFNTSGQLYREMGLSEKLKRLDESEALKLLATHGKLVKRPFVIASTGSAVSSDRCAVGFQEAEWKKKFA